MDIKSETYHARLKAHGVSATPVFSGSILSLMNQTARWLHEQAVRKDSLGKKQISIEIQDVPFDDSARSGLPQEFLDALDMDGVQRFEDLSPEEQRALMNAPPWNDDPNWIQFQNYMASRTSYDRAMPGEIKALQMALLHRWKGESWTDNDGVVNLFGEHLIRDRRAG